MSDWIRDEADPFAELKRLVLEMEGELLFFRGRAKRDEQRLQSLEAAGAKPARIAYEPDDILTFDEAAAWWKVSRRTCERMRLPWCNPLANRRLRRIRFGDLLSFYRRHQRQNAS